VTLVKTKVLATVKLRLADLDTAELKASRENGAKEGIELPLPNWCFFPSGDQRANLFPGGLPAR
jgi:hypothetical protein